MNRMQEYILGQLEKGYISSEKALFLGNKEHMRRVEEQHKKNLAEHSKREKNSKLWSSSKPLL